MEEIKTDKYNRKEKIMEEEINDIINLVKDKERLVELLRFVMRFVGVVLIPIIAFLVVVMLSSKLPLPLVVIGDIAALTLLHCYFVYIYNVNKK